jgi:hypothetical protein
MAKDIAPPDELLKKPYLKEHEVSEITGLAVQTLRNQRHVRKGIPYLKIGARSIMYKTADVVSFMERHRIAFGEAVQ